MKSRGVQLRKDVGKKNKNVVCSLADHSILKMRKWSNWINQKGKGCVFTKRDSSEIRKEGEAMREEKQCFLEEDLWKFSYNMDCLSKDFPGSETDIF